MKKVSKVQIVQNYAEALYDAALRDNRTEEVFRDAGLLSKILVHTPELNILNYPVLNKQQKESIIKQISEQLNLSDTMKNFLQLVSENGRISSVTDVLEQFVHVYYKRQGFLEVTVECVQPLTSAQDKKLKSGLEKLLKQKIVINYSINPAVLGGLTVEYGSIRIDDSIAGKLNRLEQMMKGEL